MNFFDRLVIETAEDKSQFFKTPIFQRCFEGSITTADYASFLQEAYHHVKHTVPLLMAVGARLPENYEWLREAVAEYIEEELGHQEWVLNDIGHCGFDKEIARHSTPKLATELMVAYAYDTVTRVNPIGFFGMVHVLEGTSIATADDAAAAVQQTLGLPNAAFSYLRSHGALDQEHVKFFESLMNKITDPEDQRQIIHSTKVFYQLYGNVLSSVFEQPALKHVA